MSMIAFRSVMCCWWFSWGVGYDDFMWRWSLWSAVWGIFSVAALLSAGRLLSGISVANGARFIVRILCGTYRTMQYSIGVPFHFVLASTLFIF